MGAIFLLITIPLLLTYLWVASRTTRWMRNQYPQTKWPARLTLIFWILLPTWDSILALSYHRYVCATAPDIGLTIYQTAKLDPKLFDPNTGKPLYLDKYGSLDKNIFGDRYEVDIGFGDRDVGHWPLMVLFRPINLIDHQTNTKLASIADYFPRGGLWWWNVFFGRLGEPRGISGTSCLGRQERGNLIREILVKPFVQDNNNFDGRANQRGQLRINFQEMRMREQESSTHFIPC